LATLAGSFAGAGLRAVFRTPGANLSVAPVAKVVINAHLSQEKRRELVIPHALDRVTNPLVHSTIAALHACGTAKSFRPFEYVRDTFESSRPRPSQPLSSLDFFSKSRRFGDRRARIVRNTLVNVLLLFTNDVDFIPTGEVDQILAIASDRAGRATTLVGL